MMGTLKAKGRERKQVYVNGMCKQQLCFVFTETDSAPTHFVVIIFTTRSKEVCVRMRASAQIKINPLLEEEAWSLFESIVGERALTSHPDIRNLATNVAKECKGLPLAIIVIGQAMSSKETIDEWKCALDSLRGYAAAFKWKLEDEVFIPLRYSYDDLHNDAIRSCLLYCCLYSEDKEISKKELVDKWICEEFIVQSSDFRKDRSVGNTYISTLVKANLLEECSTTRYGHMNWQDTHIPEGILSSLTNLRVLVCGIIFTTDNDHIVKELEGLKYFTDLTTTISDKFAVEQLSSSVKLMSCITNLQLAYLKDTRSSDYSAFLDRMMHLEVLKIVWMDRETFVVWEHLMRNSAYKNCFNSLRLVYITGCKLNDLSWLIFARNIEEIQICRCGKLKTLISESCIKATNGGETTPIPFAKLIKLRLSAALFFGFHRFSKSTSSRRVVYFFMSYLSRFGVVCVRKITMFESLSLSRFECASVEF